ncbi:HlyD family efflux transporter periplasmic adaptor subunit [Pseudoduganella sp. FT25W]|uniref:HlyD family efflux transporter periplasmic adaptor subunit n=1 Tax=Duganella alba TaxID=2666081 RepID=A0A6L5QP71_9BURK|nr:HlyD family efflux transporter periplasmic adaptor subunit [Duganella alba]MRX10711.1 HlyD family efflux transporter periplasmic adaptor subunit [Duganella alba]MRX18647.1 HlyD family efflux transporter periplasmic adaptor subunit [Duganella alba]
MDTIITPDIIARRKRKTLLVVAALLASLSVAAWAINRAVSPSVGVDDVSIATVRLGNIANTINASGIVIPVHEELVSSPIQTRVAKVHAKLGQEVQAGELLLELDSRTILLAIDSLKEQLAQQENRIVALTLEMEQKRKQLTSAIELLQLDLEATRVRLGRYQTLRKAGGASAEDLLTAELNVKRNEIQLRQHHEQLADNKLVTNSNIEGARLQKSILQKQMQEQQQLLAQTQVRAPFAGMLTWLMAEEGASVAVGQLVAKVSELNNYKVEASLSDFHARALNAGQKVLVEQGNVKLHGEVQTVLPEIQNGTVKLLITLAEPHHAMLRNKLRVEVNIVTEQKQNALLADSGPAFNGRGPQDIFVVRDGVARKTTLNIGASDGKAVEILSGARAGDRLIISDTSRYKDRDSVRVAQ